MNQNQVIVEKSNDINNVNITNNEIQYNEATITSDINNNGHYQDQQQQQQQIDAVNNTEELPQSPQNTQFITNEPKQEEVEQEQQQKQAETQLSQTQQQQVIDNTNAISNDITDDLGSSQKENIEQNITRTPIITTTTTTTTITTQTDNDSAVMDKSLSPSDIQQPQHGQSALSKNSSWASKFKTTSSPKRNKLGVIDRVSDNIYKSTGKGKSATTTRDGIRNSIADAITKNKEGKKAQIIWVSYAGHQKPFIPRGIKPISWDQRSSKGGRDASFLAIQHKAKSQNHQKFYLKNVLEVRRTQWRIPANELAQLQRKHPTANNYNQNNYYNNNNYNNNQNDNNYARQNYRNNYGNNQSRNNQNRRSNQRGNYNQNQGSNSQQNNQSGNK